jgi:hypothetical protein
LNESLFGVSFVRGERRSHAQSRPEAHGQFWWLFIAPDDTLMAAPIRAMTGCQTVLLNGGSGQLHANKPEVFLQTASAAAYPAFSSDGRWLAYADTESGSYDVYVRAFPDKGTRWLISNGGGTMPVWSRNGRELFYRTQDGRIMVATYTVKSDTFVADKSRVRSEKHLANTGLTPNFDLAPDGKRVVVLMPPGGAELTEVQGHVTLLTNLFDELLRIAPVTKR